MVSSKPPGWVYPLTSVDLGRDAVGAAEQAADRAKLPLNALPSLVSNSVS